MADAEPHGLFLPERPGEPVVIPVWLTITRKRPWQESAGRPIPPDELPDLDAIRARYGPGTYFVQARDGRKQVLQAREYTIRGGGRPRSMSEDEPPDFGAQDDPMQPKPRAELAPAAVPGVDPTMASMLAMFQGMMAAERQRSQEFMTTMLQVVREVRNGSGPPPGVALAPAPGALTVEEQRDQKTAFVEGMEFMSTMLREMRELSGGGAEEDEDPLTKTIATVAQAWAMKNMGPEAAAHAATLFGFTPAGGGGGGSAPPGEGG